MRRRPHEGELGRGGGGGSNLKASPEDEHASETSETRRARRRKRTRVTWNDTRAGPTILTIHYGGAAHPADQWLPLFFCWFLLSVRQSSTSRTPRTDDDGDLQGLEGNLGPPRGARRLRHRAFATAKPSPARPPARGATLKLPPCAVRLTHPRRLLAPPAPARSPPRAQVYPIWAAIGGAVTLCTFFCTRQMTTSPGFRCAHPDALPFAPRDARRDIFSSIAAPGAPPRRRAEEARSRARASRLRARAAAVGDARVLAATNAFAPPRVRAPVPDRPLTPPSPPLFPPAFSRPSSVWKDGRAEGVHEGKARIKEGEQWREHAVRKMMRNVRPQIFPGLNDAFGK